MSGWKDWAIGEVVTESEFQSFVQDQVVQVYDDATDRDNTLGANVAEGMMCYLKDIDETQVYDGTDWVSTVGDITEVVAGTALTGGGSSGSVTLNVDESEITLAQSQVTDLVSDLSNKASTTHATTHESGGSDEIEIAQSQVTGLDAGTEGFTALSDGTSGLSYQPISHNYIINGAFDIWQRGDGPLNLSNAYSADRWIHQNRGIATKSTDTPNDSFEYSMKFDASPTSGFAGLQHRIDADDIYTLAGKTASVSFYVKLTQSTIDNGGSFNIVSADAKNDFSSTTGGIFGISWSNTVVVANTWTRLVFSFTLPARAANGLNLRFAFNGGTVLAGDTSYITGVQLEAGSIATPFKRNANSIAGELQACQYYYRELEQTYCSGAFRDLTIAVTKGTFQKMRATPTVSALSGFTVQTPGFADSEGTGTVINAGSQQLIVTVTGVSPARVLGQPCTLREVVKLDAEL